MVIDKTLLQNEEPRHTGVIWADPEGENIVLKIFNNGKWRPVGGSGSGCECDNNTEEGTSNAIMINAETDFDALKETIVTSTCNKLNIDINDDATFDIMSQEEWEQFKNAYAEEALALGLTTENHGKVVETVFAEDTNFVRMLCEDGYVIIPYGVGLQEISPRERYLYISNSGEVKDAFYNDIVPNHVVHNLTDTIVKYDDLSSMYFIYNLAAYNLDFTSTDRTSQVTVNDYTQVSLWIGHIYDGDTNTFVADRIELSVGNISVIPVIS